MLTIRGHHLLCMLTFVGRGYTPQFTVRMTEVVKRIGAGEAFTLAIRPDSICEGWIDDPNCHCQRKSLLWRDFAGIIASGLVLRQWLWPGQHLTLSSQKIARMRKAFKAGHSRLACKTCSWQTFCTDIAKADFNDALL